MTDKERRTPAVLAILTLSEIKAAADRFDRGAVNVFDALDAIVESIAAYRLAMRPGREAA
jgi:hypothetical protein